MDSRLTLAEMATILDPPMSEAQLHVIVRALRWRPAGTRRDGRPGRPTAVYQASDLFALHAALVPHMAGLPQAGAGCER